MIKDKKSRSTVLFIAISAICMMAIGHFLVTFDAGNSYGESGDEVSKMRNLTQKVQGMESQVMKKEGEVVQLMDNYQNKTATNAVASNNLMDLNPSEKALLEEQIGKEQDISARAMLKEILKKRDEISQLREKIAVIEDQLPSPHIAQKGENHYTIALAFLVDRKGLEEEYAKKVLARTALFDELAQGFKVWNFYNGSEYGTSVTQGDASVSPTLFVHRAKKKIMDDRDKAVTEREELAMSVKTLTRKQARTDAQLDLVNRENTTLATRVNYLDKQANSLLYRLDSMKNLKKKGILKSGFLSSTKLKDPSPHHFDRSLDLTLEDQLVISAQDLGVKKIKDVVLYPRFYKKGSSYKVLITKNKKMALLTLVEKNKFKNERVVIAIK